MKKSIILFCIACAAYGAVLLAIGIYLLRFDLSQSIADVLVEKASIIGAVLVIVLYIPIKLIGFSCYFFIFFGAAYILVAARTIYAFCKNNTRELYKIVYGINILNCCQLALIFIADCIIVPYSFNHVSVPLIVFTALINVIAIALEIANIFAIKNIKKLFV